MLLTRGAPLRTISFHTLCVLMGVAVAGCGGASSDDSSGTTKRKTVSPKQKLALCIEDRADMYTPLNGQTSADRAKQDCDSLAEQDLLDDKGQKKSS